MTSDRLDKHPDFIVRQQDPFNGGPPPERLLGQFTTPSDLFFVRNHGGVPAVDPSQYRLTVDGLVEKPLSLSLDDLHALPRATVTATLQCAGNRRLEMMAHKPIPDELPWGTEAISNAEWSGVPLREVLAAAGPIVSIVSIGEPAMRRSRVSTTRSATAIASTSAARSPSTRPSPARCCWPTP